MLKKYVICIDERNDITNGKIYLIVDETDTLYKVVDDLGETIGYYKTRFKDIDPKREDWGVQTELA